MLKATIVGRVVNDPVMKTDTENGKPYMILAVCSRRSYKDKDGNRFQDIIPVKLYAGQAKRYLRMGFQGCKIAVSGNLETNPIEDMGENPSSFLVKGKDVEYLSFRAPEEAAASAPKIAATNVAVE